MRSILFALILMICTNLLNAQEGLRWDPCIGNPHWTALGPVGMPDTDWQKSYQSMAGVGQIHCIAFDPRYDGVGKKQVIGEFLPDHLMVVCGVQMTTENPGSSGTQIYNYRFQVSMISPFHRPIRM